MKIVPTDPFLDKIDKQQEERKAPSEYRFVGSERKVKGHELFSYNTKTGEIKLADIKREVSIGVDGVPIYSTKVTTEPNCIYVQALNIANAKKRIKKMGIIHINQ